MDNKSIALKQTTPFTNPIRTNWSLYIGIVKEELTTFICLKNLVNDGASSAQEANLKSLLIAIIR